MYAPLYVATSLDEILNNRLWNNGLLIIPCHQINRSILVMPEVLDYLTVESTDKSIVMNYESTFLVGEV